MPAVRLSKETPAAMNARLSVGHLQFSLAERCVVGTFSIALCSQKRPRETDRLPLNPIRTKVRTDMGRLKRN